MEKYYKELITKLTKLFQEHCFKEVINICNEELNLPYVPKDFEFELTKIKVLAEASWSLKEAPDVPKQLSLNQIKEKLNNENLNDFDALYLINQAKNYNLNLIISEIENLFLKQDLQWYIKFLMIKHLVGQKVDHNFSLNFLNRFTDTPSQVFFNPIKIDYDTYEKVQVQCLSILEESVQLKNPSLFEITQVLCMDLISQLYLFDQDLLIYTDAIVYYALDDAMKCLNIYHEKADDYLKKPNNEKWEYITNLITNKGRKQ